MVGIQGIGAAPDPANTKQANGSGKRESVRTSLAVTRDDVTITEEAREAAERARMTAAANANAEAIRAEQVARAKQSIEQGTYKIVDVVRVVAQRISRFV